MVHQNFTPVPCFDKKRICKRMRAVAQTFLHDGLLDSFETFNEFDKFGDENNNFRDYSLQTLIKAEAVDLLKPIGTLPFDALRSADVLNSAVGSFDNLVNVANYKLESLKNADSPAIENVENNG